MGRTITVTAILLSCCSALAESRDHGQFAKWSKIELAFAGPYSQGRGEPNPFAVRLDVDFTSPSGKQYHVPGFYDGDDKGALDGNIWKVRFSADELGQPRQRDRRRRPPALDRAERRRLGGTHHQESSVRLSFARLARLSPILSDVTPSTRPRERWETPFGRWSASSVSCQHSGIWQTR
jgi:hypothetical protein